MQAVDGNEVANDLRSAATDLETLVKTGVYLPVQLGANITTLPFLLREAAELLEKNAR